mgnify:CR=1 FL=1
MEEGGVVGGAEGQHSPELPRDEARMVLAGQDDVREALGRGTRDGRGVDALEAHTARVGRRREGQARGVRRSQGRPRIGIGVNRDLPRIDGRGDVAFRATAGEPRYGENEGQQRRRDAHGAQRSADHYLSVCFSSFANQSMSLAMVQFAANGPTMSNTCRRASRACRSRASFAPPPARRPGAGPPTRWRARRPTPP